jgi:ABC-type phosphate/phosphonate transport system substrate-binding protein
MIANARMYAVSPQAADLWRALLGALIEQAQLPIELIEHPPPLPIAALWARSDKAAVFMCGLPFSRAEPQPVLIAAPVPSPIEFGDRACYWSDLVVRADSALHAIRDTFGHRIAFTSPDSQSGYGAALSYLRSIGDVNGVGDRFPLFSEIIAPQITPLGALRAVLNGFADVAPIDSYALRLLQRFRPELTSRVRIVGTTAATPIPPLVASHQGLAALQRAFLDAHRSASTKTLMDQLLLQRFEVPLAVSYDVLRRDFAAATQFWSEHALAAVVDPAFDR